jgi:hypothetical protein
MDNDKKREILFKIEMLKKRYKHYIKMGEIKIPEITIHTDLKILERGLIDFEAQINMVKIEDQVVQVISQNDDIKNVLSKIAEHVITKSMKIMIENNRISEEEGEKKREYIKNLPIPDKIAKWPTKRRLPLYLAARSGDFDTWFENRPKSGMMAFSFDKDAYRAAYRHDQSEFLEKLIALNPCITRMEERCKRKYGEKGDILRTNKIN